MNLKPLPTPVHMLDTAYYDGREILSERPFRAAYHPTDWSQAKTKWPAVIIKQGEGLDVDPLFHQQFQAAKGHVWRGIYHFFDAATNAIKAAHAAADSIEQAGGYGELGVFLDLEKNALAEFFPGKKKAPKAPKLHGAEYLASAASWLHEMNQRMQAFGSDAPLGIYTRASFWNPLFDEAQSTDWVGKYPVWVARYSFSPGKKPTPAAKAEAQATYRAILDGTKTPEQPSIPKGFKTLFAWQWTDKGSPGDIPGYPRFKKSVDMNLLYLGPSAETEAPREPGVVLPDQAAIRLDELVRLQAVIEKYIKERKQELAAAGVTPVP